MAEANDVYGSIYQNLTDAGCDAKLTTQCMALFTSGRYADMIPVLAQYRKTLLGSVRTGQKRSIALTSWYTSCLNYKPANKRKKNAFVKPDRLFKKMKTRRIFF